MMELDSNKEAEVMIRLMDGQWVKAGQDRYRLIADDLLTVDSIWSLRMTILPFLDILRRRKPSMQTFVERWLC